MLNHGFALAVMVGLLAGGCATVEISSPGTLKGIDVKGAHGTADRAIMLSNEGCYLFQIFPLESGDLTWNTRDREILGGIRLFSHELDGAKMMNTLFRYAEREDCDVVDIVINNKTTYDFGNWWWMNAVFGMKAISISGVLRPRR